MISTYVNNLLRVAGFVLLVMIPGGVMAQSSVSLSVTPTLFNLSVVPEQAWRSNVRVINPNPFDLTVYTSVVNFEPQGEFGTGAFLPVLESETNGRTLAEWITIDSTPQTIPQGSSIEVPLSVTVPDNAAPGGHYAAILVSTVPPVAEPGQLRIRTAQMVSSLFFMRVAGDVVERASIREFTTSAALVQRPALDFLLRLENEGNVHIQPQGDITIYNMWGQKRGRIPINYQTHYGNVLPESIRQFSFSWVGETAWFDIGRYKAMATLGYGSDARRFVTSTTYFWVIPYTQLAIALGVILTIIGIMVWLVRRYIRSMLRMAGVDPDALTHQHTATVAPLPSRYKTVTEPLRVGVVDLRTQLQQTSAFTDTLAVLWHSVIKYRLFVFGFIFVLITVLIIVWFISVVTVSDRAYEVVINNPDSQVTISSEDLAYDELRTQAGPVPEAIHMSSTTLSVVNVSGAPGSAAALKVQLENAGYVVADLQSDLERKSDRTVLVYSQASGVQDEALAISQLLGGVPVSAAPSDTNASATITIFVGSDIVEN